MVMAMLIAEADTPAFMESIGEVLPFWKLMGCRIQQTAPPLSRFSRLWVVEDVRWPRTGFRARAIS